MRRAIARPLLAGTTAARMLPRDATGLVACQGHVALPGLAQAQMLRRAERPQQETFATFGDTADEVREMGYARDLGRLAQRYGAGYRVRGAAQAQLRAEMPRP